MASTRVLLLLSSIVAIALCHFVILGKFKRRHLERPSRYTARCALPKVAHRRNTLWCDWKVTTAVVRSVKLLRIVWASFSLPVFRRHSIQFACDSRVIATRNKRRYDDDLERVSAASAFTRASSSTTRRPTGSIDVNVPPRRKRSLIKASRGT
jgi:hypothetical protein